MKAFTARANATYVVADAEAAYQDPTVDTISPWLWLPPTLILLYALLWYSLRRDHFIETYYRAID